MRLTVEVTQTSFIYEYEIGENRHKSTSHISADLLCAFADLLRLCGNVAHRDSERWERSAIEEKIRREMEVKSTIGFNVEINSTKGEP